MSKWIVTAQAGCPVARYVTGIVSEEETADRSGAGEPLHRWVVEACEGQIQQLMNDPRVVRITWERR